MLLESHSHLIPKMNMRDFSKTIRINLEGVYQCCLTASKLMSHGSAIVNVASIGGILGFPNNPGYVASKGGYDCSQKLSPLIWVIMQFELTASCLATSKHR